MTATTRVGAEHVQAQMSLRVGAATDTGRVREQNEDVFRLREELGLFVVCDGMGGAPEGEVASAIAAEAILEQLATAGHDEGLHSDMSDEAGYLPQTSQLAAAVREANRAIYDMSRRDPRRAGMGTTLVSAWFAPNIVSLAHVGDSRAYLWHDGQLLQLTRDHSLVEAQISAGLLDRAQALQSDELNVLVRALGCESDVDVDLAEVPVEPGDWLLLCSDGLTRMLPDDLLAEAFRMERDPQQLCNHLVATANSRGGRDNITVVVVEVTRTWWQRLFGH